MDFDPRDRDSDVRDVEMPWVDAVSEDAREPDEWDNRYEDTRERDRDPNGGDAGSDPRDVFVADLELPRGDEREIVIDGRHQYELNGNESRSIAVIGAFRVVDERDLRDTGDDPREVDLRHLRDQDLVRTVSLRGGDRAVTLTERGRHLLDAHRRDRDEKHHQTFYAGVCRPRELAHDVQLYRAYEREAERLRDQGANIHRVILDTELKREYQEWLQESNRGRPDSDGRPDRDAGEIEEWAREHDLPYFDEQLHFPDFRIEYELEGRDRHEDVEVVTEHYRGAHARGVAQSGFRCYGRGGGGGRGGGRGFDPRAAEDVLC
jgi:hypothetical protein